MINNRKLFETSTFFCWLIMSMVSSIPYFLNSLHPNSFCNYLAHDFSSVMNFKTLNTEHHRVNIKYDCFEISE